jgi:hypothetical protein
MSQFPASRALAAQANLAWDPAGSSDVAGYKVYYGTASGTYSQNVDVGNATSYTINNLTPGQTYYFTVAAYNAGGAQSGYSNEVNQTAAIPQYTLSVAKTGTGTGTVSGTGISCGATCTDAYSEGTAVALTATPDQGVTFAGWSGGGCSGTGPCSVTMNAATTVTAAFNSTIVTYGITATTTGSGTITALNNSRVNVATSGSSTISTVTVNSGASQTFAIAPMTGYYISNVTVDGISVGAVSSYTFNNVTSNHTITSTFAQSTSTSASYTINATVNTSGGTISSYGTTTLTSGASKTYSITANSGYRISDVKVDGVSVGAVTSYTFSNTTANHTIVASFVASTTTSTSSFTINATSTSSAGTISPYGTSTISSGGSKSYTITPYKGHSIKYVLVDGVSVGAVTTYTFSNVKAGHTIKAYFK